MSATAIRLEREAPTMSMMWKLVGAALSPMWGWFGADNYSVETNLCSAVTKKANEIRVIVWQRVATPLMVERNWFTIPVSRANSETHHFESCIVHEERSCKRVWVLMC